MSFQDNLRQYRERTGISAKDFAAQLGLKYTTYAGYENQGKEPKYDTLCKIASALHVSVDELMGYQPDKLQYWLNKFPSIPLFADLKGDKVTITTLQNGENGIELVTLPKEEFVTIMEQIEAGAKKEMSSAYSRTFRLLTLEQFLNRAVWGDDHKLQ